MEVSLWLLLEETIFPEVCPCLLQFLELPFNGILSSNGNSRVRFLIYPFVVGEITAPLPFFLVPIQL